MSLINNTNLEFLLPDNEPSNKIVFIVAALLLSIIGFFGFFLNLLVIVVLLKDVNNLWTPVNVVLLNLVIGDFLVSIFGNPLALVSALNEGWFFDHKVCLWSFIMIVVYICVKVFKDDEAYMDAAYSRKLYAWLMCTLGMVSIGNLTVMAVERWMLITRPMKALTVRHAGFLASLVWIYALSLSVPPLLGWGSYGPEAGNISCSVSWETHDPITHSESYIVYLFVFGLLIPVIVIGSSYGSIILTLRKMKRRVGSKRRHEERVAKMIALMILSFLTAWLPYAIVALAAQYFDMKLLPEVAMVPAILAKSSICYNPIIYAGLNSQFMRSLKSLFGIKEVTRDENARRAEITRRPEDITELSVVKHQD